MSKHDMALIGHFEELRKRLIIILGAFMVLFILAFVYVEDIYQWLVQDLEVQLAILGPSDILWVYLMLSCVVAISGTIPIAAYQIWLFVRPALKDSERKVTLAYIPSLFLLFIVGISFGYFIIFPIVFQFLLSMSEGMFMTFFTTEKYFTFLLHMTLPFGFLFELPVVIMFLTSLGVLNPYRLQKIRKYSYFVLIVTAVLITPPDFLSDILVVIPLIFLYECSVLLSKVVYKRKQKLNLAPQ
ncbi:twin-arginine translocase subunit TatC [Neobacillus sp. 179-C4.2 HS]|uniref:Sec-independent protein translocase protein TatC n=1 Tax=Neobacillus driksii TaxID=3035913 RepID=A0ABV4Z180_9BACI|nr:twin-arginine translocase subunit TatC [Neobacillus sp. 179.-C4.2 HS]MDP5195386.1 twin-arginine translocase subunit TatC [Neobacillus sp. 179.-C4.2 HS]